jgi:hypothetical protein
MWVCVVWAKNLTFETRVCIGEIYGYMCLDKLKNDFIIIDKPYWCSDSSAVALSASPDVVGEQN